jgi:DNA-binding YbaB/EbfC family protein
MKSIEEMMKAAAAAAETVQAQMQEAQAKLDAITVEGVSGGGLVRIEASAKGRIQRIAIDDSLITVDDKQMLEDLLVAAFNDAREKADAVSNEEMGKMTNALPLPPGFKLPF